MAITRVGSTSGVNTATLPAHQAGDLILVYAQAEGAASQITLPGGFTQVGTTNTGTSPNNMFSRLSYKYATSSSEVLGTWTGATALIAHVYRGARITPFLNVANASGNSNSAYQFGTYTMYKPGTSWMVGFFGHRNTDVNLLTMAEGPMTNVVDYSDATNKAASFDTNGPVSGWPSITPVNIGGTVGIWATYFLEIGDAADGIVTQPRNLVASGTAGASHTTASFTPNANEYLIASVDAWIASTGVPAQPTISDSAGLTWTEINDVQATGLNPGVRQRTFWANPGAAPSSMTVTGASTGASNTHVKVVGVEGIDTAGIKVDPRSDTSGGGDLTFTFTDVPHPSSISLVMAMYTGANAIAEASGYTQLIEAQQTTQRTSYAAHDITSPIKGPSGFTSVNTGAACGVAIELRPQNLPTFAFRAISATVANASGNATFTEPAGTAQGDLLVAYLCIRDTPAIGMPAGWTQIAQQNVSDANITANGNAGLVMAYIVRGASAPDLVFTRTGGDLIYGVICAYTPKDLAATVSLDTSSYSSNANTNAISMTGLTTAAANELVVGMSCSGRALGPNNYDLWGGTDPAWYNERFDNVTTTGGDGSLSCFDAVRPTAGATGTVTATSTATNLTNRNCLAAFKLTVGGTAYTIAADSDAYALTGVNVSLRSDYRIVDDPGGYVVTGVAANLVKGYGIAADFGVYGYNGVSVGLFYGRAAAVGTGSYSQIGVDVTLSKTSVTAYTLTADPGAYALTGVAANLQYVGFDLFSDETGAAASGWTPQFVTTNVTWTGQSAAPGTLRSVVTVNARHGNSFNEAGSGTVDQEVLACLRINSIGFDVTSAGGAFLRGSGAAAAETYYAAYFYRGTSNARFIRVLRLNGGTVTTLQDFAYGTSAIDNTFQRLRFQAWDNPATGHVELKVKAWADGSAEPGSWTGTYTDDGSAGGTKLYNTAGLLGAITNSVTTFDYDFFTFATNRGTAPYPPTVGAYSIAADFGQYALTGVAVAFPISYQVTANAGAYTLTGVAAGLLTARNSPADPGNYALAGVAANLLTARFLPSATGSYDYAGQTVGLTYGTIGHYSMVVSPAIYTLTGIDVAFQRTYIFAADAGAYTLTGVDAFLQNNNTLPIDAGAYALTGIAVNTLYGSGVAANAGAYALTGIAVNFLRTYIFPASFGTYALTGNDAALTVANRLIIVSPGTYLLDGQSVNLVYQPVGHFVLAASPDNYVLTGQPAGMLRSYVMPAAAGSYAVSGQAANLLYGRAAATSTGLYALLGVATGSIRTYRLAIDSGAYAVNGQTARTLHGYPPIVAAPGAYTLTGVAALFQRTYVLQTGTGPYALTGYDVGTQAKWRLPVGIGSYSLTGYDVTLAAGMAAWGPPIDLKGSIDLLLALTGSIDEPVLVGSIEDALLKGSV